MPDELQELARVAAANVVRAIGTESWPTVRGSLLDLLIRYGDPGASSWVDAFGSMIAGADGREQNGLRDAAYARYESVFSGLLTTRPDAAAELALLILPSSSGPGVPGAHAAPAAPNMVKESYSSAPQPSPHSSQPQGFPPPSQFPGGGTGGPSPVLPPMPPGPPPASPYGAPAGSMYQGPPPGQGPQGPQGPHAGGPYQGGQPPMPGGHAAPGGTSSGKWLIGGLAAVVVIGGVFGGIALVGGSDDDDCSSAAASSAVSSSSAMLSAAEKSSDDCGGVGPAGQPGKGGTDDKGGQDGKDATAFSGSWSGSYENEVPATLKGTFSIVLEQSGSRVTGELDLDVATCDLSGPVVGVVTGDKVQLRSGGASGSSGSSDTIKMEGTLSGDKLTGTYETDCEDASGTWEAEQR